MGVKNKRSKNKERASSGKAKKNGKTRKVASFGEWGNKK